MRWYWMLLLSAIAATIISSEEAQFALRRIVPGLDTPTFAILLIILAIMGAFTALVTSSRGFALLALAAGVASVSLEPGFWRPLTGWAYRLPHTAGLQFDRIVAEILRGASQPLAGDMSWLLPLVVCGLLMAGVLTMGTKVE
jgi:hypothetical protein